MGLDDALIFTRVVECHSFTQAAQGLGMQKSTVSRRIALLTVLPIDKLDRLALKHELADIGRVTA